MKISKIEPQKKNKTRSSIFIDGEYKVGLSNELVQKFDLQTGTELTEDDLNRLLIQKEKEYIKERIFRILRYRDRTSLELRERLVRLGFDEPLVNEVVGEMVADKTVDDQRFAQEFVSDYTKLNPKGNRFIFHELRKKGVSPEVIEQAVGVRDEKALAKEYIMKKMKLKALDLKDPKRKQTVFRRLMTRGFSPAAIYDLLQEIGQTDE